MRSGLLQFPALLYWFPMIAIAFLNAALREVLLVKQFAELRAHQISTVTLTLFCAVYIWLIFPRLNIHEPRQALLTGLTWMILTIAFEYGIGLATHKS